MAAMVAPAAAGRERITGLTAAPRSGAPSGSARPGGGAEDQGEERADDHEGPEGDDRPPPGGQAPREAVQGGEEQPGEGAGEQDRPAVPPQGRAERERQLDVPEADAVRV